MTLSIRAQTELKWWVHNAHYVYRSIDKGSYDMTLSSDASGLGWGISDGKTEGGGRWNNTETTCAADNEINYLEMSAAFMGLCAYCADRSNIHVKLNINNTTAIAYINQIGGMRSYKCNELAKAVWDWCIERHIWVTACHLPGVLNVVAGKKTKTKKTNQPNKQTNKKISSVSG